MALYVDGELLHDHANSPKTLGAFYKTYESALEPAAAELKARKLEHVSPGDVTLYVDQHEYAVICADTTCVFSKLGSDMATTCHIVSLYHKETKVAALGHFNGPRQKRLHDAETNLGIFDMTDQTLDEILKRLGTNPEIIELTLQIVGGFFDKEGLSDLLSEHLLRDFYYYRPKPGLPPVRFILTMFCASKWNNIKKFVDGQEVNCWDIGGVVCDATTGKLTPAQFDKDARMPVIDARGARWLTNVLPYPNIYRIQQNQFVMQPYSYSKHIEDISGLLKLTCPELKSKLSTSPEVEAEDYCFYTKGALRFIQENPNPLKSVFRGQKSIIWNAQIERGRLTWIPENYN